MRKLVHAGMLLSCEESELMNFVGNWTELGNTILSWVNKTQKDKGPWWVVRGALQRNNRTQVL